METVFKADDFNTILKSCGLAVTDKYDGRVVLRNICLDIWRDHCVAVALDGTILMQVTVPCESDVTEKTRILLQPLKPVPKMTHVVIISPDSSPRPERIEINFNRYSYTELTVVQYPVKGDYVDYEKIIPAERTEYRIAVSPKKLMTVLKGIDAKYVWLSFGKPLESFLVTPTDEEHDITGLVLPARISS